jgi:subtilisin family serine protease
MRNKIVGISISILLIAGIVLPASASISKKGNSENVLFNDYTSNEFLPGEFIVKLKKITTLSRSPFTVLNEKHQVYAIKKVFPNAEDTILDNIYLLHVPIDSDILSIVREYMLCPDVVYAEPNYLARYCGIPNDVNLSKQWHLHNTGQVILGNISGTPDADIDAPEAWEIETGDPDVVIAIIDTGIDYTHQDLAANIWNNADEIPGNGIDDDHNGYIDDVIGWDVSLNNSDPKDEFGHGTMCAGVAAAVTNNNIGIAGICWNCKIMPVKTNFTIFTMMTATQGIKYAADNGADICSMSFGIPATMTLQNTIDYAYDKGVFLCAAAGNSNSWLKSYPAAYEHVVAVAATNQYDERCTREDWGFGGSEFGDWVDIAAPGSLIYSTMPTYHVLMNDMVNHYTGQNYSQDYDWFSGTSSASPAVAGVAALLLSKDPSLTPDEVKAFLCKNVDPYNSKKYIGTGRLNAYKALADLVSDLEVNITGGFGIQAVITNQGASDLTDVNWQIHVKGGILGLINKTVSNTVDIQAGESITVSTGMFFGLGSIVIRVRADTDAKTVMGKQLLIYSWVK